MPNIILTAILIGGIIFGAFCSYLAREKSRNGISWFVLGFLFSIIALITIAALPVQIPKNESIKGNDGFAKILWICFGLIAFVIFGLIIKSYLLH
ncbi:MAG: hypothetical protein ABII96_08445 [Candidatus Zixiibacteriota bacterium]